MGMDNFIIVLFFNVLYSIIWSEHYTDIYNGKINKWLSVAVWLYAAWGIFNLLYAYR